MAVYGTFLYGTALYGLSGFPTSDPWDVYDFCEPDDSTMLSLLSWSETTLARPAGLPYSWFNPDNDFCMMSDDGLNSGFRFDYSVPHSEFSFQFSFLPTALPENFADTASNRFFAGAFNQFGKCVGLLMSEEGGFALTDDGQTVSTVFPDSADIFAEGADYYVVRVVVNEVTNRATLYASRRDVYQATGVLELRYTFEPMDTPAGEVDNFRIEVVGQTSPNHTQVCLDCLRMSSELVYGNQRPVAVIADDQARVLTQYGYFDGRDSYDPDTPPAPLTYAWTITEAPDGSGARVTGVAQTPADASGYTNIIEGTLENPTPFIGVLEGDLVKGDLPLDSIIMRVADDGSWVALNRDAMVAGSASAEFEIIKQDGWGGARITGTTMSDVLSRLATPPGSPTAGDKHLIIATATDGWATHEGEVATYIGGDPLLEPSWSYEVVDSGLLVFVVAERDAYRSAGGGIWRLSDPKVWELDYWEGRTSSVGSYLADALGLYTVQLVVNDGVRDSLPAEALLNIYQTNVPLGLTPNLHFIWNYLPDVWGLVDDKDKIETFWSGAAQGMTDELMNLWQRAYSKSLLDIQRVFQRRWLNYDPWYEEPNYEELPATIDNDVNAAGFADDPTPTPVPGDPLAVDPEYAYVLNSLTGTGDAITADSPEVGTATLEDAAGAFSADAVGKDITISGASDPENNGTFPVTSVTPGSSKNGTNFKLSTLFFQVTLTSNPPYQFVPSDVGKSITIAGVAHPFLNGTYTINTYISPSEVRFTHPTWAGGPAAGGGTWSIGEPPQLAYTNPAAVTVTESLDYIIRDMPRDAAPGHRLVLEGIGYRITRIEDDTIITAQAMPVTDRPKYWMIRPMVVSRETNFTLIGVAPFDTAVFEVRTEDGDVTEIPATIFGVRGKMLAFDDATSLLSGYLASDTYTVRFKGVLRRTAIAVDELVMNVPRLQEAIKLIDEEGPVPGVPDPLIEGLDFRVEMVETVEDA